jgi:hypothetical protein
VCRRGVDVAQAVLWGRARRFKGLLSAWAAEALRF